MRWTLISGSGKLGAPARFFLAFFLYVSGCVIQFVPGLVFPGFAFMCLGWIPLALKVMTTKPSDQGFEEWRAVSASEIDRIKDTLAVSRKTSLSSGLDLTRGIMITILLAVGALIAGIALGGAATVLMVDFCLFIVPALFFGRVRVFMPKDLKLKLPCIYALLSQAYPEGMILTPYLRFDKDAKGLDVPEDVRAMLELKRKPADFVGVQLQVAINNGENGEVPYLYAVFLFKGSANAGFKTASALKAARYVTEVNPEGEYGTVVLRQDTGGGGYYTTPEDCVRLAKLAVNTLVAIGRSA